MNRRRVDVVLRVDVDCSTRLVSGRLLMLSGVKYKGNTEFDKMSLWMGIMCTFIVHVSAYKILDWKKLRRKEFSYFSTPWKNIKTFYM